MLYQFYEIKSLKSQPVENGSWQISLACKGEPLIKIFFWFQKDGKPSHIQLFYNEKVLDWKINQGLFLSVTNRYEEQIFKLGTQKGVRNLIPSRDKEFLIEGLEILTQSSIPEAYQQLIQEKILKTGELALKP